MTSILVRYGTYARVDGWYMDWEFSKPEEAFVLWCDKHLGYYPKTTSVRNTLNGSTEFVRVELENDDHAMLFKLKWL